VRKISGLVLALSFWLLTVKYHLTFSHWISSTREIFGITFQPKNYSWEIFIFFGLCTVLLISYQLSRTKNKTPLIVIWITISFIIWVINLALLTTPLENIHFLQYGIIAWLLAYSIDSSYRQSIVLALILISTALGILDEFYQYVYLTRDYGNYLDFNDFILNQIGSVCGLTLYYGSYHQLGSKIRPKNDLLRISVMTLYGVAFSLAALLFYFDYLRLTTQQSIPPGGLMDVGERTIFFLERAPNLLGHWHQSFSSDLYFVIGPIQWIYIFLCIAIVFPYAIEKYLAKQ